MNIHEIHDNLRLLIGNLKNEPAESAIGKFMSGIAVPLEDVARELDVTEGCEDLAQAVRNLK